MMLAAKNSAQDSPPNKLLVLILGLKLAAAASRAGGDWRNQASLALNPKNPEPWLKSGLGTLLHPETKFSPIPETFNSDPQLLGGSWVVISRVPLRDL